MQSLLYASIKYIERKELKEMNACNAKNKDATEEQPLNEWMARGGRAIRRQSCCIAAA